MVHQVPLPVDDDDSFMPPSDRDSRGQLLVQKEVKIQFGIGKKRLWYERFRVANVFLWPVITFPTRKNSSMKLLGFLSCLLDKLLTAIGEINYQIELI